MSDRPPERDELDALLDPLVRFARQQLEKHGEFFPFGAVLKADGTTVLIAGDTGSDRPDSEAVIGVLLDGLRRQAQAGDIRAAGWSYDVRIRDANGSVTDAIAVALEHREGDSVHVFLPYSKGRFRGLRFGDMTAGPGERRVF